MENKTVYALIEYEFNKCNDILEKYQPTERESYSVVNIFSNELEAQKALIEGYERLDWECLKFTTEYWDDEELQQDLNNLVDSFLYKKISVEKFIENVHQNHLTIFAVIPFKLL